MNPKNFDPGPLSPVECQTKDGRPMLVFTRELRHSPEKVWGALTDPAKQREWAPFISDRDLAILGPVTMSMNGAEPPMEFPGEVLRATPPALLEHTFGEDLITWELAATETGTHLTLRHVAKALDWIPKVAAGWHGCIVVLERLLDGNPIGPIVGRNALNYGWLELHDAYAEKLGIEPTPLPSDIR